MSKDESPKKAAELRGKNKEQRFGTVRWAVLDVMEGWGQFKTKKDGKEWRMALFENWRQSCNCKELNAAQEPKGPLSLWEGPQPRPHLDFIPARTKSDFQPTKLQDNTFVLFQSLPLW